MQGLHAGACPVPGRHLFEGGFDDYDERDPADDFEIGGQKFHR